MRKVKGKVLVTGSAASGKSALLQLYTTGEVNFLKDYQPVYILIYIHKTQIAEISSKLIPFEEQEKDVELFFFDMGGSVIYSQAIDESQLMKKTDLIIICYDPTRKASFQEAESWYDRIKKASGASPSGALVATKLDLKQIREVSEQEGMDLAKRLHLEFFQLSTARNQDIESPFTHLAKLLLNMK